MFKSVPVADRTWREADVPPAAHGYRRDTLTLGWLDRLRVRGRRSTDGGVSIGLALPRGTVLRGGDQLVLDAPRLVVAIVERAEPVFVIEPDGPEQWGLFAYHIGNRHQPLMITARTLVCPDEAGIVDLLEQYQMPYVRAMMPFTPVAAMAPHTH